MRSAHKRLLVRCPCRGTKHSDEYTTETSSCCKSRKVGPRTTSVWGEIEPWALLGCWLEKTDQCSTRLDHMVWTPSAAEIRDFIERRGWNELSTG